MDDNNFSAVASLLQKAINSPGEFQAFIGDDVTDKLREAGVDIDAGTYVGIQMPSASAKHGNININVKNAGADWHGAVTLNLEKGDKGADNK